MSTISIIGLGSYARAIGTRGVEAGHAVEVIGRDAAKTKDLAAAEKELKQCVAKLENPQFTDRAPADVVAKITARRAAATAEIERLRTQLAGLA